jgi:DNA helicase-2/ATP-dependent DNA helicase PcrA
MASRSEQAQRPSPAPSPYHAGDRVKHRVFGEGVVVACALNGADQEITVAFPGQTGVKRLLLAYAPLEKA